MTVVISCPWCSNRVDFFVDHKMVAGHWQSETKYCPMSNLNPDHNKGR